MTTGVYELDLQILLQLGWRSVQAYTVAFRSPFYDVPRFWLTILEQEWPVLKGILINNPRQRYFWLHTHRIGLAEAVERNLIDAVAILSPEAPNDLYLNVILPTLSAQIFRLLLPYLLRMDYHYQNAILFNLETTGRLDLFIELADSIKISDHRLYPEIGLWYYLSGRNTLPDQVLANWAFQAGKMDIVRTLADRNVFPTDLETNDLEIIRYLGGRGRWPTRQNADTAAGRGQLSLVKYLYESGVPVTSKGAAMAAKKGHFEVVRFLAERGIFPTSAELEAAANRTDTNHILQYLSTYGVHTTTHGAFLAAAWGNEDYVRRLAKQQIYPHSIDEVIGNGHLEIAQILLDHGLTPSYIAANYASAANQLLACQLLNGISICPTLLTGAAELGYLHIIDYWWKRDRLLTDNFMAGVAAIGGHLLLVQYLIERGVNIPHGFINSVAGSTHLELLMTLGLLPDSKGANIAAKNGRLGTVQYLINRGVYPTIEGLDGVAGHGHLDIILFVERKLSLLPSEIGAGNAARAGHLDVVQYLVQKGIYPSIESFKDAFFRGHHLIIKSCYKKGISMIC